MKKYIVISPYHSGLSNILMSLEVGFAIAYISDRDIILPRKFIYPSDGRIPTQKINIWKYINLENARSYFNIHFIDEIAEFTNLEDEQDFIIRLENDTYKFTNDHQSEKVLKLISGDTCFFNSQRETSDLDLFAHNRFKIDVNRNEKFITFDNNLFGHYWFMVYPGGPKERNKLKQIINSIISYEPKLYDLVKDKLPINGYNAIHVRYYDFMGDYWGDRQRIDTPEKLLKNLQILLPNDKPLYVATDMPKDFFQLIKSYYELKFLENYYQTDDIMLEAVLDQIIASKSQMFYGTKLSTFTKRINIIRGINQLPVFDYMGINYIHDNTGDRKEEFESVLPWTKIWNKNHWPWHYSSYPQWTME